ncbi:MAG TPA: (Fe-S)-binding protein, partial [Desulfobacteraceae bacterium]|nr:(Fe-S)-binding protein [Desulfobacteraceae bacterium]
MYTRIYFLRFPKETSDQPIIYYLVKRYDVEFNILKADILPQREGIMIIEFKGNRENIREALSYLKD